MNDRRWVLDEALDRAEQLGYEMGQDGLPRISPFMTPLFNRQYNLGYDRAVMEREGVK